MNSRSPLVLRGLLPAGAFFWLLTLVPLAHAADDLQWQPAGTRDRQARQASVALAADATPQATATPATAPTDSAEEPQRIDGGAARSARPLVSASPQRVIPASFWREPGGDEAASGDAAVVQQNRPADSAVRRAVVSAPPPPRAHRPVAYHARPYPMAPWHPHPSYAAYATGPRPPARFVASVPDTTEVIGPGQTIPLAEDALDPEPAPAVSLEGEVHFPTGDHLSWGPAGSCSCHGPCQCAGPCYDPWFGSIFFGVQGFKGPLDLGRNGNFGFHEGFELAIPSPIIPVNLQLGMRFTQNNFEGDQVTDFYRDEGRDQVFLTTGLFRRADGCCPWQWGVVFDWLHDEYWVDADFSQLRVEISRLTACGHEWGFLAAVGTGEENFRGQELLDFSDFEFDLGAEPTDYYGLFWRRSTAACGEWRALVAITEHSNFMLGGDFWLPLGHCLALDGDFTFLLAEKSGFRGQQEEAFGIGLSLVWYPHRGVQHAAGNPLRPLLGVADNARFFVNRK